MSLLKQPFAMERRRLKALMKGGFFALNDLDKKMRKYIGYDGGYYVELGANDGLTQSNTYYYEIKHGWRGVLIEPAPHKFIECKRLRGKNNSVHCSACVGFEYSDYYIPMRYADLMTTSENIDLNIEKESHISISKEHYDNSESYEFCARARTLTDILDESKSPYFIDFLSLDVEGAESEVLKGINFDKYTFKYMLIETSRPELIKAPGYRIIDQLSNHDYLFSR